MITRAYAMPHPPLAVPEVGRGQEKKIAETLAAFTIIAEEIAAFAPETIIYITPHGTTYADYFHISPGSRAKGDLADFSARDVSFDVEYDALLADEITRLADKNGLPAGQSGEKKAELDHGVTVPMYFINKKYENYKAVRISQSGLSPAEHYKFGRLIAEAAENLGRKAVLVASGDLSHKLSAGGPYGYAPEGEQFDKAVTQALSGGDFHALLDISDNLREGAAECGYNSYIILAGCFDKYRVEAKLLVYECPFGVGYASASFSREDIYRSLARQSLEFAVKNRRVLALPDGLPDELIKNKAGVFVSLHKNGELRGCIGTIAPAADNIALEIINNAVSSGLRDSRFEPVAAEELPLLVYKVDVLAAPEPISGPDELDVKKYGVIVTSGGRRGLLLPNLDGVDTVDEQITIAKRKAGIPAAAPVKLERFEVVRHE